MATATYSVRMDTNLKSDFDTLCDDLGMNASTAFTVFAKKAVAERRIPFEVSAKKRPSDYGILVEDEMTEKELREELARSEEDIKAGRVYTVDEVFNRVLGGERERI